jgi:serine/threonine-protein kinase
VLISLSNALRWPAKFASLATPRVLNWALEGKSNRAEGERHLKAHNWTEAEKYLTQAIDEAGHNVVRRTQLHLMLAEAQRNNGKFEEAEQTVRAALETTAKLSNPGGYVQCLDALAHVYEAAGKHDAAEAALEEGIRIESQIPRPDPLRMARRVHHLGMIRHQTGRSLDAIPALEKSARLHEELMGEEHLETARLLSELGRVHRSLGNHEEAQKCLRRSLRIHERTLGHDSPETVSDLHHLAGSLEESGDIDAAAELFERSLALKHRVIGGDLEELADMQFGLATTYIGWSNYARARELLAEAIGTFRRKKGARLAIAYEVSAHIEECCGHYLEAVGELARAGKVWEACGPERVRELADNLAHRAQLLEMLRNRGDADWLRRQAAALTESSGPTLLEAR